MMGRNYVASEKGCNARVAGAQGGFCRNDAEPGSDYCAAHNPPTYDLLYERVKEALVSGEACCHVNDPQWTREFWQDAFAAAKRLREEIDYAR